MDDLVVGRGVRIPASELRVRFSRSGGPGGQNVNVRDTRVEVSFDLAATRALSEDQRRRALATLRSRVDARGRLRVVSQSGRTQAENRRRALESLRALLAEALRPPPPPRKRTAPTRAAKERRLSEKRARARTKRHRGRPVDED